MNALDRHVGELIAELLHDQDPRFTWTPQPATPPAATPVPPGKATLAGQDHPATPPATAHRHAA